MLNEIDKLLFKNVDGTEKEFVDLFAGSNVVGNYFKDRYRIITNDMMYFSYAISRGIIQLNSELNFESLKKIGINDPIQYFNDLKLNELDSGFITDNYTPRSTENRMYFTEENGMRIDTIRKKIGYWRSTLLINDDEFFYLLSSLLESVTTVSNITGTYGAYLKHWDKRSLNKLELRPVEVKINKYNNQSYNDDSMKLVKEITGDIVYIDTPYNTRQYAPNYHVLETIAKYDDPEIKGVTGQRDYGDKKSGFSMKREAKSFMENLISELNFKHAVLSYSTDGIISETELEGIIKQYAKDNKFTKVKVPYRKYKSKINNDKKVYELLYYFMPIKYKKKEFNIIQKKDESRVWSNDHSFIKSPLNYIGGKYKLLPQIMPLFPSKINTFVDLFSGGANVGINANASKYIFNDINYKVNELFESFQKYDTDYILSRIYNYINEYNLSKTNSEGFNSLREDYNKFPDPIMLYTLVSYSFNYQFRFNSDMKYNNPFGKNRSYFSDRMQNNLIRFVNKLHSIDASFTSNNFTDLNLDKLLCKEDFVYADPPYLITLGSYNDGKRGFLGWDDDLELKLYKLLDDLNDKGVKFALSNVIKHKGKTNEILLEWSKKYNVHYLEKSYKNSSYNTKREESIEVLITNYKKGR